MRRSIVWFWFAGFALGGADGCTLIARGQPNPSTLVAATGRARLFKRGVPSSILLRECRIKGILLPCG